MSSYFLMSFEKNIIIDIKQQLSNRVKNLSKRFWFSLFDILQRSWKNSRESVQYLRRKKMSIFLHTLWLLTSVGIWWVAYYALFPLKVYQTKRTDRLFHPWNENDLIKKQWMIDYSINDKESTFLIDMLAGMW
jgi:hypothetical protein